MALEWDERWSYGHPIILLEPVIRFSTLGGNLDDFIDSAILDIVISYRLGEPIFSAHNDELDELIRHRWNPHDLRGLAEKSIMDDGYPVGEKKYRGVLKEIVFIKEDGIIKWKEKK